MTRQARLFLIPAVALFLAPVALRAQDNSAVITGRVTSDAGTPLAAANVTLRELNLSTVTQADGRYRLVVPGARATGQSATLVARMLGYQAQTFTVRLSAGETIAHDFALRQDPLRLQEVVVTGAGTETIVERLGTSRAAVTGTELQRAQAPENLVTSLAGKVPNVLTNQQSGDAGSSTAIQIRGAKTFGTSQPVFVVDGVVMSNVTRGFSALQGPPTPNRMADINPEDIESIEILKGAAATSIYGASAGSAGAILVTTKKGRAGHTQYTVRTNYQADQPIKYLPVQQKYGMGNLGVSTACVTNNCQVAAGNARSWGAALPAGTPVYDHARETYETGQIWDNSLSMSGGTDRTTFYLSAGSLNHDGFIVSNNDYLNRYSVRFNGSHALTENLTFGASGSYVQTKSQGVDRNNSVNGIGIAALRTPPEFNSSQYLDATNGLHRSFRFPNPTPVCSGRPVATCDRGWDNPFFAIYHDALTGESGRIFGNVNADYRPLTWLQLNWTLGADYNGDDRTFAYDQSSSGKLNGDLERWQFYDRIIDHNLSATARKSLTSSIESSLTVGQNLNETYFRQVDTYGQTLISPQPYKISNLTTLLKSSSSDSEQRRHIDGYFAQANFDLYDQLFLQARVRNDGSSAFGIGHQRATYPGASAAWSFTKYLSVPEKFLSFGKLRVAYGESGQQPGLYQQQDVFTTTTFADFNPGSIQAPVLNGLGGSYASASKGNPDIAPERVRELEAGIDLSFLNGRADLSVTNYTSKSSDVIFGVGLPPSTGYTTLSLNAGGLSNKGWEVTTNYRPIQSRNLLVEIGATWGMNKNLVTDLGRISAQTCTEAVAANCAPGTVQIPTAANCTAAALLPRCQIGIGSSFGGQTTHAEVGYPLGVWRSVDFARCGISDNLVTYSGTTYDVGAACAGAPKGALYIAPNGFPITDATSRAIGNPWPDWTGGLNALVQYRGIEVSAFVDHRQGGDVLNMTRASMYQFGTHKDTEIRGQQRTFGKDMLCHNQTCDVLNGPVVGPGANTAVTIGQDWFDGGTPGGGQGATGGPISTRLEDGTHTRLREVTLGYTFRQNWVQMIGGASAMDLKLSARNLGLWTNYSGLDPEVSIGGAQNANRGIDWFGTPLSRGYIVSIALHK
ncbi:MAG TPA: SusC/RagA family TonB-linked outer membrane protein [Gemmatimonadaceae bacterium]|nr:SusC/RagA family TonB-linked outer membrane protein [Gemmatimonadaceae bacterium]